MADVAGRLRAALADRYAVERELGQGGMATVYLAYDVRHDRKVALKVLRPELAAILGAERFLAEIKTTANLQHPHILPLHDSGEAGGFVFYVMPYVDGESLRDRLTREKQLPIADVVRIATEVAGALDYAHRHGVVHRDIKPENVLLHEGQALVADFGIALAVSRSDGGTRMTETGMSLGTPHYMSPEQAMGEREITPKSDVYALGAMTYEMLLGEPPFTGPTAQSIVAKVMTEKPAPLIPRRDTVPPEVEDAVLTALAKLPADRFATAADFAAALTGQPGGRPATAARAAHPAPPVPTRALRVAVGIAALATATAAYFALQARRVPAPPVSRFGVAIPNLRWGAQFFGGAAILLAPDGSRIVYVGAAPGGGTQLWSRDRNDLTPHPLEGTVGADGPFFSPDGRWIGYFDGGRLFKIPSAGGTPIALADSAALTVPGGAWLGDDRIVFTSPSFALLRVPAGGGTVETIQPAPAILSGAPAFPAALPRADRVLLTECTNNCAQMTLVALNFRTHEQRTLLQNTARAWYLPSGILVAVRQDGSVVGARFDPGSLRLSGSVVPLLSGVQLELGIIPEFSVADDGSMLYLAADPARADAAVVRVDRSGRATVLDPAWRANLSSLALSPDGRRLAVSIQTGGRSDIWVKQLDAGPLTRLTFAGTLNYRAAWRPDGRSMAFTSDRDGGLSLLYSMRADGSGSPERLMPGDRDQIDESQWSRDGRWLVYRSGTSDGTRNIYARAVGTDTTRVTVSAGAFDEYMPTLSPDGRWVAYVSVESGHEEVYVRPFPQADRARWQVSTSGGSQPVWTHSGRELLYLSASDSLMSVAILAGPDFHSGPPTALFSARPFLIAPFHQDFAIAPDDRSFIMLQSAASQAEHPTDLTVVLNWFAEVEAKLRGARP
jgi:Tol biopolymer transport system component/tRNA A-37 threonylcarbamoyl transferase component Bud32